MFAKITLLLIEIVGVALIGYGAWLHYPPLGFGIVGFLLWFEVNQNVFKVDRKA